TPKSSTSSATHAPEPGSQSQPTSIEGSTQPAPHPIQSTSVAFASDDIRPCQPGTIRLLQCESIVASALSYPKRLHLLIGHLVGSEVTQMRGGRRGLI